MFILHYYNIVKLMLFMYVIFMEFFLSTRGFTNSLLFYGYNTKFHIQRIFTIFDTL